MTITSSRLVRVSVAILLATTVGILAVACAPKGGTGPAATGTGPSATGTGTPTHTTPPDNTVPALDAVAISDAVLFNQGPAARYLTRLNRPQVKMTDAMTAVRTDIDTKLAADSGFASSFASRMQSGDPVAVQAALGDIAKAYVRPALDNRFGAATVDAGLAAYASQLGQRLILQIGTDQDFAQYAGDEFWTESDIALVSEVAVVAVVLLVVFVEQLPNQDLTHASLIRDIAVKDLTVGLQLGAQIQ
jgi:hypothetical protein